MTCNVEVDCMPSGRYSVMIHTPQGPTVGDGLNFDGVVKCVTVALLDMLEESYDPLGASSHLVGGRL